MKNALPAICLVLVLLLGIAWAGDGPASRPLSPATQATKIDPAKEKDIRRLLELNGMGETPKMVSESIIRNLKEAYPTVEAEFWAEFRKEFDANAITGIMLTGFAEHLDEQEIKGLIAFFQTPLGRKWAVAEVAITKEASPQIHKWMTYVYDLAAEKLRDRMSKSQTRPALAGS